MIPTTVTLLPHLRGDTWPGIFRIGPVTLASGGPAFNVPAASVRMAFRTAVDAPLGHELSTAAGSIQVLDAAAWIFTVPPQALPLRAAKWLWDLQTVDVLGIVRTLYAGTLVVQADIT